MCGENNDCHQIKNKLNYVKKIFFFKINSLFYWQEKENEENEEKNHYKNDVK